jgi:alpha-2-macroglobulin
MTTNVPINTGIEFVFNYAGADFEKFITIEPQVEGRFEEHDRVIAFVPKKLEEKTIYTVTIKAGLPLKDSDKVLSEDVVFSFETATEEDSYTDPSGYMSFNNLLSEFSSAEVPEIVWNYYFNRDNVSKEAKTKVFSYNDAKTFMSDLASFNELPYWSHYNMVENLINVDSLNKVMDFNATLSVEQTYPQLLTLPEKLNPGFYLVEVQWEDQTIQSFFQVTDLSFYYTQSSNGDLFWLNDLKTKSPVEGATVTSFETGATATSDELGIARFITERKNTSAQTQLYHIQKGDQQSVLFSMNYSFWRYGQGLDSNAFWRYFKSDRGLYKPDDTVEFFGFLKGRYEDINLDEVSVEVTQGGYYYFDFLPYNMDQLSFVVESAKVTNGFFDGSLTLPNLAPGGYELVVKYKGERVSSTYITVENYIKPSYKLSVEKDKKAIFVDEPINYILKSLFLKERQCLT